MTRIMERDVTNYFISMDNAIFLDDIANDIDEGSTHEIAEVTQNIEVTIMMIPIGRERYC